MCVCECDVCVCVCVCMCVCVCQCCRERHGVYLALAAHDTYIPDQPSAAGTSPHSQRGHLYSPS